MTGQIVENLDQKTQRLEPPLELGGVVLVGLYLLVGNLLGLSVYDFRFRVDCVLTARSRTNASPKCSTT